MVESKLTIIFKSQKMILKITYLLILIIIKLKSEELK